MLKINKLKIIVFFMLCCFTHGYAQLKVGDNPSTINSSSMLEVEATDKGFLMPRVALTATNAAAPLLSNVAGMVVYNTATASSGATIVIPGFYYNDGTQWVRISGGIDGSSKWTNNSANSRVDLTNLSDGITARSGDNQFLINDTGNVGIGTSNLGSTNSLVIQRSPSSNISQRILITDGQDPNQDIYDLDNDGTAAFGLSMSTDLRDVGSGGAFFDAHTGGGNGSLDAIVFRGGHGAAQRGNTRNIMTLKTSTGNVGIGTTTPRTTLHVVGDAADTAVLDGIIPPHVSGVQLRAKTYTTMQTGAIVFVHVADTAPAGQTVNVTAAGHYSFDGTVWQPFSEAAAASKWTNNNANTRVNLTNLSDGTTARSSDNIISISDNGVLGIGTNTYGSGNSLVIEKQSSSVENPRILMTNELDPNRDVFDLDANGTAAFGLDISPDTRSIGTGAIFFSAHTGAGLGTEALIRFRGGHGASENAATRDLLNLNTSNGNVGLNIFNPAIGLAIGDNDTGLDLASDGELSVFTNNVERVRFDAAGNVGIGTINPLFRLHSDNSIASSAGSGGNYKAFIGNNSNVNFGSSSSINLSVSTDANILANTPTGMGQVKFNLSNGTANGSYVSIGAEIGADTPNETLNITSADLVGIGTTNPLATLHVVGDAADTAVLDGIIPPHVSGVQLRAKTYTTMQTGAIVFVHVADTAPAGQTVNVTAAGHYSFDGTVWQAISATAAAASKWTNNAANTRVDLTNLSDGSTTRPAGTEFVVTDAGKIGVGLANPDLNLEVFGSSGLISNGVSYDDGTDSSHAFLGANSTGTGLVISETLFNVVMGAKDLSSISVIPLSIYDNGNVAIGNSSSPYVASEKLDVDGNIRSTGNLRIGNVTNALTGLGNVVAGENHTINGTANIVGGATNIISDANDNRYNLVVGNANTLGTTGASWRNVVGGNNNSINGSNNSITGALHTVTGTSGVTTGQGNNVSSNFSIVGGQNNNVTSAYSITAGRFSEANNSARLVIGNGTSDAARSNTFVVSNLGQVYAAGNVGIGVTNPLFRLHSDNSIASSAGSGGNYKAFIGNNSNVNFGSSSSINLSVSTDANILANTPTGMGQVKFNLSNGTANGSYVSIGAEIGADTPNETLNITSADLVGIGTTNPTEKLDVVGNLKLSGPGNGQEPYILFQESGFNDRFFISSNLNGFGTANQALHFGFNETAAAPANANVKMSMRANGNVGIGTTNPNHKLHVVGTAGLSTGTAWTNTSDLRLKENVKSYTRGLKEILQINPVYYSYTDASGLKNDKKYGQNIGIIAQELKEIIPEAISVRDNYTMKDGTKMKDVLELSKADAMWFALINAVKEQQAQIEEKNKETKTLKKQVSKLQQEIELIKKSIVALKKQK